MVGMQEQEKACIVQLEFVFAFYAQGLTVLYSVSTPLLRMTSFRWEWGKNHTDPKKDFRAAV